jgi:cell division protein FtsL
MNRLNLVLLLVLVASALYLVHVSYESRRLVAEQERQRVKATRLHEESERLEIARRDAAKHLRVEKEAAERLGMRAATPGVTTFVNEPASTTSGAGAASRTGAASAAAVASGGRP